MNICCSPQSDNHAWVTGVVQKHNEARCDCNSIQHSSYTTTFLLSNNKFSRLHSKPILTPSSSTVMFKPNHRQYDINCATFHLSNNVCSRLLSTSLVRPSLPTDTFKTNHSQYKINSEYLLLTAITQPCLCDRSCSEAQWGQMWLQFSLTFFVYHNFYFEQQQVFKIAFKPNPNTIFINCYVQTHSPPVWW